MPLTPANNDPKKDELKKSKDYRDTPDKSVVNPTTKAEAKDAKTSK